MLSHYRELIKVFETIYLQEKKEHVDLLANLNSQAFGLGRSARTFNEPVNKIISTVKTFYLQ